MRAHHASPFFSGSNEGNNEGHNNECNTVNGFGDKSQPPAQKCLFPPSVDNSVNKEGVRARLGLIEVCNEQSAYNLGIGRSTSKALYMGAPEGEVGICIHFPGKAP